MLLLWLNSKYVNNAHQRTKPLVNDHNLPGEILNTTAHFSFLVARDRLPRTALANATDQLLFHQFWTFRNNNVNPCGMCMDNQTESENCSTKLHAWDADYNSCAPEQKQYLMYFCRCIFENSKFSKHLHM